LFHPWLFPVVAAGLLAAMQVVMSHQRLELTRQQSVVEREARKLNMEISRLTLELATLTRPERLRRLAVSKLDMRPPRPMQVVQP